MAIQKCKDLKVYNISFSMAMEIFRLTKKFPREELFSLVDQIRRSSRSVAANIREGFAKRRYTDVFLRHLTDALGSSEETMTWLDFAYECEYISKSQYDSLLGKYEEIGRMLYTLIQKWERF